jgi:four helix bundle protein
VHNYKKLQVWQDAVEIAVEVYALTKNFPSSEQFGLVSQLRRASVSVASNIAEGSGRNNNKEFNHFLGLAAGSSYELETQLIITSKLEFCDQNLLDSLIEKIEINQKMIYQLKNRLTE